MTRLVVIAALVVVAGCGGSARRSETIRGTAPPLTTPAQHRGELVFMRQCNQCHPLGEGGLGPSLHDVPLPDIALKAKVRGQLPGDMPKFSEKEIAPEALDDLVAYLQVMRRGQ